MTIEYELDFEFKFAKGGKHDEETIQFELRKPTYNDFDFTSWVAQVFNSAQMSALSNAEAMKAIQDSADEKDVDVEDAESKMSEKEKGQSVIQVLYMDKNLKIGDFLRKFYRGAEKAKLIMLDDECHLKAVDAHLSQLYDNGHFEALAGAYIANFIVT